MNDYWNGIPQFQKFLLGRKFSRKYAQTAFGERISGRLPPSRLNYWYIKEKKINSNTSDYTSTVKMDWK